MTTSSSITNWTTVTHPTFHKPYALVGISQTDEVLVVIPLVDLRDANLDGLVSRGERVAATIWRGFGLKSQQVELLMSVAVEMADPSLYQLAHRKLFAAGFTVGIQRFQKLHLQKYLGDAISLALDQTTLNVISKYFIKRGCESVFYRILDEAKKAHR